MLHHQASRKFKEFGYERFRYFVKLFLRKNSRENKHLFRMNKTKLKVNKMILQEVY